MSARVIFRRPLRLRASCVAAVILCAALLAPAQARAQESDVSGPAAALTAALSAACRGNETAFSNYLTGDNAAAFRALPEDERTAFLKRFSLSDTAGKPLLSENAEKESVLRCEAADTTVEYVFGQASVRENLAYIPVSVMNAASIRFGMVREAGGWHMLSVGLVLLDIPQLAEQWKQEKAAEHDEEVADTLRKVAGAIHTYQKAFGKLPGSLAQLGPAPKDQISPDQASLVDEHIAAGEAGGYRFRYTIVPAQGSGADSFELGAVPDEYGKTGRTSFLYDTNGKIHSADKHGAMASASDPLLSADNDENNP